MSQLEIRRNWEKRQQEHGNQPRAVLMKGLHPLINESIDLWHRDVMRSVFSDRLAPVDGALILDVGCGFGRLADEITRLGRVPVGLDFTQQFCAGFAAVHGDAICATQTALPFVDGAFSGGYSVTSLMYLEHDAARLALIELNRCLATNGLVLLLEPCREFNEFVRMLLPAKRRERLAMPGFTRNEVSGILPSTWSIVAAGDCRWLTMALPLLAITTRWPRIYRRLASLARRLDRPVIGGRKPTGTISLYRWVACRKTG
mgnify:CR=1 FL=1